MAFFVLCVKYLYIIGVFSVMPSKSVTFENITSCIYSEPETFTFVCGNGDSMASLFDPNIDAIACEPTIGWFSYYKDRRYQLHFRDCNFKMLPNIFKSYKAVRVFNASYLSVETVTHWNFDYASELMDLNMESNQLISLPSNVFSDTGNLETVNFAKNRISAMDSLLFQGTIKLKALNMSFNKLTKVSKGTFDGLKVLEILDLGNNLIEEIDKDVFKDVIHLKLLNVTKNQLKILSSIPECSYLVASDNQIQHITFNGHDLLDMIEFNVANNHIDNIPEIIQRFGSSLVDLNLRNNYVGVFNISAFSLFRNLQQLNLRNTSIKHIEFGMLHLPSLHALDISFNGLEAIDFTVLRWGLVNLKKISVLGYPLKYLALINKTNFRELTEISIGGFDFDCDDLSKSLDSWRFRDVKITPDAIQTDVRSNQFHIDGIPCYHNRSGNSRNDDELKPGQKPETHNIVLLASCITIAFICGKFIISLNKMREVIRRRIERNRVERQLYTVTSRIFTIQS